MSSELVVTCEHGGNRVPARYAALFRGKSRLLASHRGWDPGTLEVASQLSRRFDAPLIASTTTRLLVDLNRSRRHRALFSEVTRPLDRDEREEILAHWYRPHRERVIEEIGGRTARGGRVFHLGVHSFTPVLDGETRRADIALLYDPRRRRERAVCTEWARLLAEALPDLRIRRNSPYRGAADGLTTELRNRFPAGRYLGIELEINQRFPLGDRREWRRVREAVAGTLALLSVLR